MIITRSLPLQELVNEEDTWKCYPIHRAAGRGDLEILNLLLEHGAQMNHVSLQGSPLCIAALEGHEGIVKHLLSLKDIDLSVANSQGETALHQGIRTGNMEICQLLVQHPQCPVNCLTSKQQTALHYVVLFTIWNSWEAIIDDIVERDADLMLQDHNGQTALHIAIQRNNVQLTKHLIKVLTQKQELKQALQIHDKKNQTPFRELVRNMPGIAKSMLDACIEPYQDTDTGGSGFIFDLSLLEDTFTESDDDGKITLTSTPYTKNYQVVKDNHPLKIVARRERHQLLAHPVLKMLLHRKWTWASTLYIFFVCFYAAHVISVSVYMITASPPFQVNQSWCEINLLDDIVLNLWNEEGQGYLQTGATAAVAIIAAIGAIIEVIQLVMSGTERLTDLHNLFDWFTYISAVLIIINFTKCNSRTHWQWQLGVACVFIAWMNFLFYLRKAPKVGIYIVMIGMICQTFLHFFAVFFLFILVFAITFYLLLQNQYAFRDVFLSIMKTWVMMVGEMDFTDLFHSDQEDDSHEVQVYFPEITYAVFIAFLIFLSLIIMNLLTALAIRDVNKLLEDSGYQLISMQIRLALDIEFANPVWCHQRVIRRKEILTRDTRRFPQFRAAVSQFFYGPLSKETILTEAEVILGGQEEGKEEDIRRNSEEDEDRMKNLMDMITQLMNKVDKLEKNEKREKHRKHPKNTK